MEDLKLRIRKELEILEEMIDGNYDEKLIKRQRDVLENLLCEYIKDL